MKFYLSLIVFLFFANLALFAKPKAKSSAERNAQQIVNKALNSNSSPAVRQQAINILKAQRKSSNDAFNSYAVTSQLVTLLTVNQRAQEAVQTGEEQIVSITNDSNINADSLKSWIKTGQKYNRSTIFEQFLGALATSYRDAKNSDYANKCEIVIRFAKSQRLHLKLNHQNLNENQVLASCLLFSGEQLLAQQIYPDAVKKLAEAKSLKSLSARETDSLYMSLAKAYHGEKNGTQAINTINEFQGIAPHSPMIPESNRFGAQLSLEYAFEDNALAFLERYCLKTDRLLRSARNDGSSARNDGSSARNDTKQTCSKLADLYLAKQRFDDAVTVMTRINANDPRILDSLYKAGSDEQSLALAQKIISGKSKNSESFNLALRIVGRASAKKGNTPMFDKALALAEKNLDGSSSSQETLAELRFLKAQTQAQRYKKLVITPSIRNPNKLVEDIDRQMQLTLSSYKKVCEVGETSWCPGAQFQLARMGENYFEQIDRLDIAQTLDQQTVGKFESAKTKITETLSQQILTADSRAIQLITRGPIAPIWIDVILWHNQYDANFEKIANSEANHYVDLLTR